MSYFLSDSEGNQVVVLVMSVREARELAHSANFYIGEACEEECSDSLVSAREKLVAQVREAIGRQDWGGYDCLVSATSLCICAGCGDGIDLEDHCLKCGRGFCEECTPDGGCPCE